MDVKDFKKRFESETDQLNIRMSEKVKNAPVSVRREENVAKKSFVPRLRFALSFAACLMVFVMLGVFALPNATVKTDAADITSYIIEINPSLCITADADDKVLNICALNDDADEILSDDKLQDAVGKSLTECLDKVINVIADKGFLDGYSDTVRLYAVNDNKSKLTKNLNGFERDFKNGMREYGFDNIPVEKREMSLDDFKGKTGFEGDFKRLDDMKDFLRERDRFFNPDHQPPSNPPQGDNPPPDNPPQGDNPPTDNPPPDNPPPPDAGQGV